MRADTWPDHPFSLHYRRDLALSRGDAGDTTGAIYVLEALLADHVRVLGPDHPYTLTVRSDLLQLRDWTHNPTDAVTVIQTLLADRL